MALRSIIGTEQQARDGQYEDTYIISISITNRVDITWELICNLHVTLITI